MTQRAPRNRSAGRRDRTPVLLADNRPRARRLRVVCWLSVPWAIAWVLWAAELGQTFGLSAGDGGVLRPAGERSSVAALVAAIGLLPVVGLSLYARRYTLRLARVGEEAELTLLGFWAPIQRRVPITKFERRTEHEGRFSSGGVSVHAPWITLRIGGKRYILDRQAERIDQRALRRLIDDAADAGPREPVRTRR